MSKRILVDSNILLDIITVDPMWFAWSSTKLAKYAESHVLVINPIIYAEISIGFKTVEELDGQLALQLFQKEPLPWEAGFIAGKAFVEYKKRKGTKLSPLPDFFIGAHAVVKGMALLTRDKNRYNSYFPQLKIIAP